MRCLILGATGQIGTFLSTACADRGAAHLGTWYRWPHHDCEPLDLRDEDSVDDLISDYQPDVTFLTVSAGCNEWAEENPAESLDVAVGGTQTVASAVARAGGSLVYFSSNDVFGDAAKTHKEDDPLSPANVAAEQRVLAESAIRRTLPDRHLILRTNWVYGPDDRGRGWTNQLIRKFQSESPISASEERVGQPTFGPDLAEAALELARMGQNGTVHVVGPDKHSELSFARIAAFLFGADVDRIRESKSFEIEEIQPSRAVLDRMKLRSCLGPRAIRGVSEGLRAVRAEWKARATARVRVAA